MPPSYIRVRAVMWAFGRGQTDRQTRTDTQTRVTTIHFASSTTHAKCNKVYSSSADISRVPIKTLKTRNLFPSQSLVQCLPEDQPVFKARL